mmetsp:Transcript_17300/g.52627  ORF Transcript_17300/g.52627 Transcript_17300/m.52627 type:complete len:209 (-) Transcript_17300:5315-5941(-)
MRSLLWPPRLLNSSTGSAPMSPSNRVQHIQVFGLKSPEAEHVAAAGGRHHPHVRMLRSESFCDCTDTEILLNVSRASGKRGIVKNSRMLPSNKVGKINGRLGNSISVNGICDPGEVHALAIILLNGRQEPFVQQSNREYFLYRAPAINLRRMLMRNVSGSNHHSRVLFETNAEKLNKVHSQQGHCVLLVVDYPSQCGTDIVVFENESQ